LTQANQTGLEESNNLPFDFGLLAIGITIRTDVNRWGRRLKVDTMDNLAGRR